MKHLIMISTIILGSTFVEGADLAEAVDGTTPTSPTKTRLEILKADNPSADIARPDPLKPIEPLKNSPRVPSPLAPKE